MGEGPSPLGLGGHERSFVWRDGERRVHFVTGTPEQVVDLLRAGGFARFALLTTARAGANAPMLTWEAGRVLEVPPGPVPEAAASVRDRVEGRQLVALGGGRVIDAAKAIGAADRLAVAAVPTTLSGAEMTAIHRLPAGVEHSPRVRPRLVIADPERMASQPEPARAASAMNALGHAADSLYTPLANPVAEMAALRAAGLIAAGLEGGDEPRWREGLALGSLLAAYALDSAGFAVHHVVCQTLVRMGGAPHAETNAVMLPHTLALVARRGVAVLGRLALALGAREPAPGAVPGVVARLARPAGPTTLGELGIDAQALDAVTDSALQRPELANTPEPPGRTELRALFEAAL